MMRINYDGRTIGIGFAHPTTAGAKKRQPRRATIARIWELPGGSVLHAIKLAEGETRCSLQDNFLKETGRKNALTRALAAASADGKLSPTERKVIWDAYLNRPRPKTPKKGDAHGGV